MISLEQIFKDMRNNIETLLSMIPIIGIFFIISLVIRNKQYISLSQIVENVKYIMTVKIVVVLWIWLIPTLMPPPDLNVLPMW